jgi:hypothetical protein
MLIPRIREHRAEVIALFQPQQVASGRIAAAGYVYNIRWAGLNFHSFDV